MTHDDGYLTAAQSGSDIFTWTTIPQPADLRAAQNQILIALLAAHSGSRLPFAIIDLETDTFVGTTSFYDIAEQHRALAIGHTWMGKPWWSHGHNTEAKLLLLSHAFDSLGAVRVTWHIDSNNARSLKAVEKIGAQREGELRKHRRRVDGSWRTTVQFAMTDEDWPEAKRALTAQLEGLPAAATLDT